MTAKEIVDKYLGIPYVDGGRNPTTGLDCWGLIMNIQKDLHNIIIFDPLWWLNNKKIREFRNNPNKNQNDAINYTQTSTKYLEEDERIRSVKDYEFGDILVFNSNVCNFPTHAGVYLGKNRFIHAVAQGTITTHIKQYKDRLVRIYRVYND